MLRVLLLMMLVGLLAPSQVGAQEQEAEVSYAPASSIAVLPFITRPEVAPAGYRLQAVLLVALETAPGLALMPGDAIARVARPSGERDSQTLGPDLVGVVQALGCDFAISGIVSTDATTVEVCVARGHDTTTADSASFSDPIPLDDDASGAVVSAAIDLIGTPGAGGVVSLVTMISDAALSLATQSLSALDEANAASFASDAAGAQAKDAEAMEALMSLAADLGELPLLTAPVEHVCRAVLNREPDSLQAVLCLGLVHYVRGDYDQALGACARGLQIDPEEPRVHNLRGLAFEARDDLDRSEAAFRDALAFDSTFAMALCNLGRVCEARGDFQGAQELYAQAISLNTDSQATALAHVSLAAPMLEGDAPDFEAALQHLDTALAVDPGLAEAHYNRGIALSGLERADGAVAAYRAAIEHRPGYAEAYNNLGVALYTANEVQEAAQAYSRALEAAPGFWLAHRNLAIAREKQEDYRAAEAEWLAYLSAGESISAEDVALAQRRLRYAQRMLAEEQLADEDGQ